MKVLVTGTDGYIGCQLSSLLLGGQKAVPARLLEAGFTFQFTDLRAALDDLSSRL